jgi:hypothetical protein
LTAVVKKSVDADFDDHQPDEDKQRVAWSVAVTDDCEGCDDLRVEVTFEEIGRAGMGIVAHLSPASARRLRAALGAGLRDIGEPIDG